MWVEHDEVSVDDILVGNRPVVNLRTRDEERSASVPVHIRYGFGRERKLG